MSGSNSGPTQTHRQSGKKEVDCDLKFDTHLSTPVLKVVKTLKKGEILNIELVGTQGPLRVVTKNGEIAGR